MVHPEKPKETEFQREVTEEEGFSVDFDLYISSLEPSQGPIHFRFRSNNGLRKGILILEYTRRTVESQPEEN